MRQVVNRMDPAARGGGLPWAAAVLLLAVMLWTAHPLTPAHAADGAVAFEFITEIETCADYVWVGDIARFIEGDAQYWERISGERISYGPQPGTTLVLTAATVIGRLAERGYDWRKFSVRGADQTSITAGSQVAGGGELAAMIAALTTTALGVPVVFETVRALPEPILPSGELVVELRFPDKAGVWLPDGVELLVDGEVMKTIPLGQYGSFRLPVVVAPQGIDTRTQISAGYLGIEEMTLRPGSEAVVSVASVTGLTTTARVSAGGRVVHSKLRVPYAIERGDEIVLVINTGGISMRARAEALNNAYLGQRLLVKRVDDGQRFTGVVAEGPEVVVE